MGIGSKLLSLLALAWLLSGAHRVVSSLGGRGTAATLGFVHLGCIGAGLVGFLLAFGNWPALSRALSLLGVGLASLIVRTDGLAAWFPGWPVLPLTFRADFVTGAPVRAGLQAVPAGLFVLMWVARKATVVRRSSVHRE